MRRIALIVFLLVLPGGLRGQGLPAATDPIVFVSGRDIHVMNPDGSNQTQLTASDNWTQHSHPAWSPDRSKIAFSRISDRLPSQAIQQIYVMNADGSNVVNLSNLPDNTRGDAMPAWSPDGTRIAFVRGGIDGTELTMQIYVMNADGSNQTEVTDTTIGQATSPAWSPDGTKIAFSGVLGEICVINSDGSNASSPTCLTSNSAVDDQPEWSPDGTKIVFMSWRDSTPENLSNTEIYLMNADGSNQTNLTNDLARDEHPSFSPDGSRIVFVSDRHAPYNTDLYLMNADGSDPVQLTNTSISTQPSWNVASGTPPVDPDGDGVPDSQDNCPFTANPNQADNDQDGQGDACDTDDDNDGQSDADETACGSDPLSAASTAPDRDGDHRPDCADPDDDNDGWLDGSDNCPLTPNPIQANHDNDILGDACDPDDDNDGVADASDNCPLIANPDQADPDADGLGNACDPDDDNDGVGDGSDNCPLVPNASQADADGDGVGDACDPTPVPNPTIVFARLSGFNHRIHKMQGDGSNATPLTSPTSFYSEDRQPALSPDGSRVVFTRVSFVGWDIYRMNADGTALVRLTGAGFGLDGYAAWSPDGTKIVYACGGRICVMNQDGSNVRTLTNNGIAPAWSPDGTRIAFVSLFPGNFEIQVMNADGSGVTRLTSHSATDWKPTWSPDGTRIAFQTNRHGTFNFEIYSMNAADGTGLARLTNRPGNDLDPAWGASGEILFSSVSSGSGNRHVHKMNADGSGVTALPAGIEPHW
jgi:Tol biopolymer transport system component